MLIGVGNDAVRARPLAAASGPTAWRAAARRQAGVVTRAQLRQAGLRESTIDRLLRRGFLDAHGVGVFVVGGAPLTYRARLWRAVLATGGALCSVTAGQLWGVAPPRPDVIHVLLPHGRRISPPGDVRVLRWRVLPAPTCTREGLPVTTREWTVMSLIARLPPAEAVRLADRALQRGWISREDILSRLARYPKRHGNTQLRRLLELTGDNAASEAERLLHSLLRSTSITGWVANYAVWVNGDLVAVVDVAVPRRRLAIEVDGMAYHTDVDSFRSDRHRQNQLVALGWTVLRFTWADLTERRTYVRAAIEQLAA